MTSAIAGMTIFGWVTQEFGERPSVFGIGVGLFLPPECPCGSDAGRRPIGRKRRFPLRGETPVVVMVTQPTSHLTHTRLIAARRGASQLALDEDSAELVMTGGARH